MWILLKQETVSGSGIRWAICKSAPRSRQITTPAPHHSVFLQAGCPSCRPTNRVKALKAKALKANCCISDTNDNNDSTSLISNNLVDEFFRHYWRWQERTWPHNHPWPSTSADRPHNATSRSLRHARAGGRICLHSRVVIPCRTYCTSNRGRKPPATTVDWQLTKSARLTPVYQIHKNTQTWRFSK